MAIELVAPPAEIQKLIGVTLAEQKQKGQYLRRAVLCPNVNGEDVVASIDFSRNSCTVEIEADFDNSILGRVKAVDSWGVFHLHGGVFYYRIRRSA